MPDIYDQHKAAFARVSAYVILKDGKRVATVAFKCPADGAGRLYAYVHVIGLPMVRGFAGGYGYDKRSAAVYAAVGRINLNPNKAEVRDLAGPIAAAHAFAAALKNDDGHYWNRKLEDTGFTVLQAI